VSHIFKKNIKIVIGVEESQVCHVGRRATVAFAVAVEEASLVAGIVGAVSSLFLKKPDILHGNDISYGSGQIALISASS